MEQYQIREGAEDGPIDVRGCDVAAPLVKDDPDGLLGGEVRVAGPGPETGRVETAIEIGAFEFWGDFGGFLVLLFGVLVLYCEVG